ncbi:GNAT family N-acetyltransferase [Dokdonella sp.]|uniref:GNAT family N-acetyltransferase n=1 Tax=Dokdonella sp. TaxID=2291710 RepID=UPI0025C08548|nr:GNAT family N-acetyltransferase [Dokdonella sp.]MBX3693297.1 GNAT family N-acetyltransferase [Dokdonella sp.]MCW5567446.1 GNAT family N-acetyltransferase [Dokdonella sp.]
MHAVAPPEPPALGTPFLSRDGDALRLRPIHADDVSALLRAFGRMSPEQIRMRVFHALTELPEPVARYLCTPHPDKVAAFVVTDDDGGEIRGEARVHFDPISEGAEFAIAIDPAFTGKGVGWALMTRLIEASREHGMREIWGHVLAENGAMLDLADRLGFERAPIAGEPGLLLVRMAL